MAYRPTGIKSGPEPRKPLPPELRPNTYAITFKVRPDGVLLVSYRDLEGPEYLFKDVPANDLTIRCGSRADISVTNEAGIQVALEVGGGLSVPFTKGNVAWIGRKLEDGWGLPGEEKPPAFRERGTPHTMGSSGGVDWLWVAVAILAVLILAAAV